MIFLTSHNCFWSWVAKLSEHKRSLNFAWNSSIDSNVIPQEKTIKIVTLEHNKTLKHTSLSPKRERERERERENWQEGLRVEGRHVEEAKDYISFLPTWTPSNNINSLWVMQQMMNVQHLPLSIQFLDIFLFSLNNFCSELEFLCGKWMYSGE